MPTSVFRTALPVALAVAMLLALVRAAAQSITIDEAVTYLAFVLPKLYWLPAANNHLLNTVLTAWFTERFGVSEFTVRLPAMLGALLHITAVGRLCWRLVPSPAVRLVAGVALVYNPFVLDHLVAARGYSLALGLQMWAVAVLVEVPLGGRCLRPLAWRCALASLLCGLSISANFSFAVVNVALMAALLGLAWTRRTEAAGALLLACVVPAAVVLVALCGQTVMQWPAGQFIFGAESLGETVRSVIDASLYRSRWLPWLAPFVFPGFALASVLWLRFTLRPAETPEEAEERRGRMACCLALLAVIAVTLFVHWLGWMLAGILLPKDRTAVFLFPLAFVAVVAAAERKPVTAAGRVARRAWVATVALMAVYFVSCLRLDSFKEWFWDAEVQNAYAVIRCLNQAEGVRRIGSGWPYVYALNFYRSVRGPATLEEIVDVMAEPEGVDLWILSTKLTPGIVEQRGLQVFDRGRSTDWVLAAEPEAAARYAASGCVVGSATGAVPPGPQGRNPR